MNIPPFLYPVLVPIARRNPKNILRLRYWLWTHKLMSFSRPTNLQQYTLAEMIKTKDDPELLKLYAKSADKYAVREIVKEKYGEEIIPKLLGVWEKAEDIDFDALPDSFVLKTNNGCGTNIIVRDKARLDREDARTKLTKWLKLPYGELSGQIHYAAIPPRIIAEELLKQEGSDGLPNDYKFFCFDGEPQFILYYEGRQVNGHITYNKVMDLDWNEVKGVVNLPSMHDIPRPASLEKMVDIARKLSKGYKFVRVDLYDINGKPVFGELTFTPDVITNFTPEFLEEKMPKE